MATRIPGTSAKTKTYTDEAGKLKAKSRHTSPEAIYSGRTRAAGCSADGDGLSSKKQAAMERMLQKPQDHDHDGGESRAATYDNEVPLTGDRAWLRGGGDGHRPRNFDGGGSDMTKPAKGLKGGGNCEKSPFSAAGRNFGKGYK
jgi:hypothetical protein